MHWTAREQNANIIRWNDPCGGPISIARFSAKMQEGGHDIRPGDLVVDLEEVAKSLLRPPTIFHPIYLARSQLQLAIVTEVEKRICE
jgi:hypothetical protein